MVTKAVRLNMPVWEHTKKRWLVDSSSWRLGKLKLESKTNGVRQIWLLKYVKTLFIEAICNTNAVLWPIKPTIPSETRYIFIQNEKVSTFSPKNQNMHQNEGTRTLLSFKFKNVSTDQAIITKEDSRDRMTRFWTPIKKPALAE